MGAHKRAAAAGKGGDAGPASERRSKHAQWDALDRPQRSAVAGIAGGIWPLAVCICPICQMAGRWYIGSHISCIVRRCGYGKPEPGFYLHQGSRKCQWRGAKTIRAYICEQGASYVIPPQSNVSEPWPVDWWLYKERHLVECFFQKLKWFRRIATRYDKLDVSFLAFVYIAAIAILLI